MFDPVNLSTQTVMPLNYMYELVFGSSNASQAVRNSGIGAAIGVMMAIVVVLVFGLTNFIVKKRRYRTVKGGETMAKRKKRRSAEPLLKKNCLCCPVICCASSGWCSPCCWWAGSCWPLSTSREIPGRRAVQVCLRVPLENYTNAWKSQKVSGFFVNSPHFTPRSPAR